MTNSIATNQTILVVGGGIGGMTAALEAAECGKQVILVERNATLGGRTALMNRYFPKMCHPTCGLEINLRRLKGNRNVRVMTMAEVSSVTGQRGDYTVTLKLAPRYVNANCTACGDCAAAVEAENTLPVVPGQRRNIATADGSLWWQPETSGLERARHPAGKTQADRLTAKIVKTPLHLHQHLSVCRPR